MKQGRKPRHWLLEKSEQQQVRAYRWAKVVGVAGTLSTEQVPTSEGCPIMLLVNSNGVKMAFLCFWSQLLWNFNSMSCET